MKLILLGAPGAGKGTQAEILSRRLNIPMISTGNILRAAVKNGTHIGLIAKSYMESGQLVPDSVIMEIIKERLSEPDCLKGYILDGFPRTIGQAIAIENNGLDIDIVFVIEISNAEIEARITGRLTCPVCNATYHIRTNPPKMLNICNKCSSGLVTRKDDEPETVKNRLKVYHKQTKPLIDFYKFRNKLMTVDNQATIEATTEVIKKALDIVE